ncbi:MAG: hypothetical protein LBU58_04615 [Clostridiales bacterium]|jgi:hypothetical protein|nr:hypothetical protein [Clostridiales bacterium]
MPLFLGLVAAGFGTLVSVHGYLWAFLIPGGLYYLYTAVRAVRTRADLSPFKIQGGIFCCCLVYWALRDGTALFYHALSAVSLGFSGAVGWVLARPVAMGPTYSGVDVVCLFLIASILTALFSESRAASLAARGEARHAALDALREVLHAGLRAVAVDAGIYALIWAFYVGFWTVLAENSIALGLNSLEPLTGPLDFRLLLFALLLCAYHLRHRTKQGAETRPLTTRTRFLSARAGASAGAALFCLGAAVLLLLPARPPETAPPGRQIVFWDSGIDFTVPSRGVYGLDRVGMFGVLPGYLEKQGYRCRIVKSLDGEALSGAAALVVLNPMRLPDTRELGAVWDFVKGGGGLLAVGDHTGDAQIRKPMNAILRPVGIEFNFDSAVPFQSLWPKSFVMRKSPVFAGLVERQLQIVVGASLTAGLSAKPLLIGKNGYSDGGDMENTADGYLGDMQFSRGERVGDLILAAEARYGAGKFIAFGDTTFLQNSALAYSAPFVNNLFAYLTVNSPPSAGASLGAAAGDVAAMGDVAALEADAGAAAGDVAAPAVFSGYCLVETSHLPSFSVDKSDDAVDGFVASALRAGLLPYLNLNESLERALERLGGDLRVVVLDDPAAAFSDAELFALRDFVRGGGTLLALGGYESPRAVQTLCRRFGFSFDNLPIGRIAPTQNPEMAFWNACPVLFDAPSGAVGRRGDFSAGAGETFTLMEIWGNPVVAGQKWNGESEGGGGELIVFGDSDFIKNKNLESAEAYRTGNIEFIEKLLDGAVERAADGYAARAEAEGESARAAGGGGDV